MALANLTLLEPFNLDQTANYTFANVVISGNISANYVLGNGALLTGLPATYTNSNASSYIGAFTGNIAAGNANLGNVVVANYFSGSGNLLSNVQGANITGAVSYATTANSVAGANVTGQVSNALVAGTVYTNAQPNITSVGTLSSLTVTSNITSGNANLGNLATASYFSGNGSLLSALTGANVTGQVSNALVAGTVYTNAQPNITSVGTLSSLTVTGALSAGDTTVAGNLTVTGATTYVNSVNSYLEDPLITLGGGANNAALTTNDGYDRGIQLHYYTTQVVDAFMGWKNSAGEFVFASNATVSGNSATINTYGNIHAGNANLGNLATSNYFSGNGSLLTAITGANITGTVASATTASTANSVAGANVTGQVSNALVAGTVYANAQPNITSVGTLASLNVTGAVKTPNISDSSGTNAISTYYGNKAGDIGITGNLTVGTSGTGNLTTVNASLGNLATSNYFSGSGNLLSNIQGANVTGAVASATSATTAGTVTASAQPNITSTGTLSSVNVTGNISSAANLTAAYLIGNGSQLTGLPASYTNTNVSSYLGTFTGNLTAGNANISGTITTSNIIGPAGSSANISLSANTFVSIFDTTGNVTLANNAIVVANLSVGTTATITGNVTSGNANLGNLVTASYFSGNGSLLTSLAGANVTGQVANALVSGTVYTGAQPNITSIGTLVSLTASGNITSGNANLGNLATANYYSGNGSALTSLTGANVTGQVGNSLVAGTVYTGAQPNITSVGTLTSLTATGNISSGNANLGNLATSNYFSGSGNLLSNIQAANITGTVSTATTAATVTTNAQPNITSVGTLTSLTVSGTTNLGAVGNVTITGGTSGQFLQTNGSGTLVWATASGGGGSSVAGTNTQVQYNNAGAMGASANFAFNNTSNTLSVDNVTLISTGNLTGGNLVSASYLAGVLTTKAQPNITSTGTLTSLNVTGAVKTPNISDSSGTNAISTYYGSQAGDVGITGNLTVGTGGTGNLTTNGNITSVGITANGVVNLTSTSNVSLGAVANVKLTGGSSGQYLKTDGTGNLSWGTPSGGGGGGSGITYTAATTPPGSSNIADQWFNTTTNVLYEYMSDGTNSYWFDITTATVSSPAASNSGYVNRSYTGDGSTNSFTVSSGCNVNNILAFLNGVCQMPTTDYTITSSLLAFDVAPTSGTVIQIRELPH